MDRALYLNKDVSKIVGITQRQCLSWSDKGLIIPDVEAAGAGTKREYNYLNLIEFGVADGLFYMGQGVQSVKRILCDLREKNALSDLSAWAEDPKKYFKKIWEKLGAIYRDPLADTDKDAERWRILTADFHRFFFDGPLKVKGSSGFLYYFKGPEIKLNHFIFPELYDFSHIEAFTAFDIVIGNLSLYKGAIILNIGNIKDDIDRKLRVLK